MIHSSLRRILFAMCLMMLLFCMPCAAEEELQYGEDRVLLYSEGELPPPPAARVAVMAADTVEDAILEAINKQADKVSLKSYNITPQEFNTIYRDLINNRPELFFVSSRYQYTHSNNRLYDVFFTYKYKGKELKDMISLFNSSVDEIVRDAKKANTTIGRMLRANEYFCTNYHYDTTYTYYSPEELFAYGTGVCQAYMLAYRAVLDKLGITSSYAKSDAMNHIWNMVYLDGSWYHIDVTWNDPVPDIPLTVYHTSFLCSDDSMIASGHYSWDACYVANSSRYDDALWVDFRVPLTALGDYLYYTETDYTLYEATIMEHNLRTGSTKEIYTYSMRNESGNVWYTREGRPMCSNDMRIYFSVWDDIYSVDHNGENLRLEYTLANNAMMIWRMDIDGYTMRFFASNIDSRTGDLMTVEMGVPIHIEVEPAQVTLLPGQAFTIDAHLEPVPVNPPVLTYATSNDQIVSVDQSGLLSAHVPGNAVISIIYNENVSAACNVLVRCEQALVLPEGVKEIHSEAFTGATTEEFVLPEGVTTIGSRAFAGSDTLLYINLPESLAAIEKDAFDDCEHLTLICEDDSYAHIYTHDYSLPHVVLPDDDL